MTSDRQSLEHALRGQLRTLEEILGGEPLLDLRVAPYRPDADAIDLAGELFEDDALETLRVSTRIGSMVVPGQRTFLIGVSGVGKTITLAQIAAELTRRALAATAEGRDPQALPLWLSAPRLPADAAGPLDPLVGAFESLGVYFGARDLIGRAIQEGRLVVLIDGLQEIPGTESGRWRTLRKLYDAPHLTLIAASRPGFPVPGAVGAAFLRLAGLRSSDQAELLARHDFTVENAVALERLARRPGLRRVLEVPLVWRMAMRLQVAGEHGEVERPATLYERFVDLEITRWRKAHRELGEGPDESVDDLLPVLELLAAAAVLRGARELVEREAEELITRWASARREGGGLAFSHEWPRRILDHLPRFYQPVLREVGEERRIGFAHGSLAEFLTARWLLRVRPSMVEEHLPLAEAADVLAFCFDLRENAAADDPVWLASLDQARLERGSAHLVVPWLRRVERNRLEAVAEHVRERVRRATGS